MFDQGDYWPQVPEETALETVAEEMKRQAVTYGNQMHLPDGTLRPGDPGVEAAMKDACNARTQSGLITWRDILAEEVAEVNTARTDKELLAELAQVAAVSCSWMSAIMRRARKA
jgi:hypothetical protein